MNNLTFFEYVETLTKELGPHYIAVNYNEERWIGFVYCECFYGKNHVALEKSGPNHIGDFNIYRPMRGLGAVARIEHDRVVVLDHRQSYDHTGRISKRGEGASDSTVIHMAQPNFHEEFVKIKLIHDVMQEYFKFGKEMLEFESSHSE